MTENEDWGAYRKLFEQEMKDNHQFREEFRTWQSVVITQLTELKTQRNTYGWIGNLVLTGVVAAVVAWFTPSR